MKRLSAAATLVAGIAVAFPGNAQDRWSVDVRAGTAVPTRDVPGGDLGTGIGFEGLLAYRFLEYVSAYAGWDWHSFGADESFAGMDTDFVETGYAFGLWFERPYAGEQASGLGYRLRAGGTYNHIEIEGPGGGTLADSGHGAGWEVGFAIVYPLSESWRLSPGLRYRGLSRDVSISGTTTDIDLRYMTFNFGVTRGF